MEKAAKTYFFSIFYLWKIRRIHSMQAALNELSATFQISFFLTGFPATALLGKARFEALDKCNRGRSTTSDSWHRRSAGAPFSKFKFRCFEQDMAIDVAIACA
ncbi:MAG: hypothetical protein NXI17_00945 [Alphaproteobacteria bacterium]|nr:hypothetical protein [Alphaproteobacteria bacterium]